MVRDSGARSAEGGSEPRWRDDGKELYYLSEDRNLVAVSFENSTPGKPEVLFRTSAPAAVNALRMNYAPLRDGQSFLINTQNRDQVAPFIRILANWTARLPELLSDSATSETRLRDRTRLVNTAGESRTFAGMPLSDHNRVMKQTLRLLFPLFLFLFLAPALHAADVRVTDSNGIEVMVREIAIDYGGLLGSDKETEGIRIAQGDAFVTTKWTDIQSLAITGRDDVVGRMKLEIVLKNGKTYSATLVRKGRMKLTGKADLGEYSIDLEKIRKITVVSAK
jgi:hypothetical protein